MPGTAIAETTEGAATTAAARPRRPFPIAAAKRTGTSSGRAAIHAEGEATRALISQIDRERLLREMNSKDAKIAQLEAQQFNSALAAGTAQQTRNDMNAMLSTIISHVTASRQTGSGSAAA